MTVKKHTNLTDQKFNNVHKRNIYRRKDLSGTYYTWTINVLSRPQVISLVGTKDKLDKVVSKYKSHVTSHNLTFVIPVRTTERGH